MDLGIESALSLLAPPMGRWPDWVVRARYDADQYPGRPEPCPIAEGANCQRYAYAVLALHGLGVPPHFSSDLWEDPTLQHVAWANRRPLDLVLFSPTDDPVGAHMGVVLDGPDAAGAVLHLCREVGVPAVWTLDEFTARPRYSHALGPVRVPRRRAHRCATVEPGGGNIGRASRAGV